MEHPHVLARLQKLGQQLSSLNTEYVTAEDSRTPLLGISLVLAGEAGNTSVIISFS